MFVVNCILTESSDLQSDNEINNGKSDWAFHPNRLKKTKKKTEFFSLCYITTMFVLFLCSSFYSDQNSRNAEIFSAYATLHERPLLGLPHFQCKSYNSSFPLLYQNWARWVFQSYYVHMQTDMRRSIQNLILNENVCPSWCCKRTSGKYRGKYQNWKFRMSHCFLIVIALKMKMEKKQINVDSASFPFGLGLM